MSIVANGNLALRFALELAMLAGFGYWGFATVGNAVSRFGLVLGAPLIAMVLWGMLIASKARRQLPDPGRLLVEIALFSLASAALVAAGRPAWATLLAVVIAVSIKLMFVCGQRRSAGHAREGAVTTAPS